MPSYISRITKAFQNVLPHVQQNHFEFDDNIQQIRKN